MIACLRPPAGWWCSRPGGHTGPCAAREGAPYVPLTRRHEHLEEWQCRKCGWWNVMERISCMVCGRPATIPAAFDLPQHDDPENLI